MAFFSENVKYATNDVDDQIHELFPFATVWKMMILWHRVFCRMSELLLHSLCPFERGRALGILYVGRELMYFHWGPRKLLYIFLPNVLLCSKNDGFLSKVTFSTQNWGYYFRR